MSDMSGPQTTGKAFCLCHQQFKFKLEPGAGMFGRDTVIVTDESTGEAHQFDLQDGMEFDADMMDQWLEANAE